LDTGVGTSIKIKIPLLFVSSVTFQPFSAARVILSVMIVDKVFMNNELEGMWKVTSRYVLGGLRKTWIFNAIPDRAMK